MSGVIASPEALEEFARALDRFTCELKERSMALSGQFQRLGEEWRDERHCQFAKEFVEMMKHLHHFSNVAETHVPTLRNRAGELRRYRGY